MLVPRFLPLALVFCLSTTTSRGQMPFDSGLGMEPGVVVEKVENGLAAATAGLQKGDVILRASRGDNIAAIESPFDLAFEEVEQAPRAVVSLEGLRGAEKQTWILKADRWGITTRPNFHGDLRTLYLEADNLRVAGKPTDAAERLQTAAAYPNSAAPMWIRSWLLSQAAAEFAAGRQWKRSDVAYRLSVGEAARSTPLVRAQLLWDWARSCRQRSDWPNAEKHYQEAIEEDRKLGLETLMTAALRYDLGMLSRIHGDLAAAQHYLLQALETQQKQAPGSLTLSRTINGLGAVALDRTDLAQADEYYRQALDISQRLLPNSLVSGSILNNLGIVAWERGDLAQAEEFYLQDLGITEKLAPDDPGIGTTLNNLGLVASDRGDLAKAEEYHRRALQIRQRLASNSLSVAGSFANLGIVAWQRGDLATAEKYYLRDLEITKKLAPGSLDLAHSFNNLGRLAIDEGNPEKAERYYLQAFQITQKLAPDSLLLAHSFNNLGRVASDKGDLSKAQDYLLRALEIKRKLAPVSLDTAATLNHLGDVARKQNELLQARGYYSEALEIRRNLAPDSADCGESFAALAGVMRLTGDAQTALALYGQAVSVLESQTSRLGGSEGVRAGFRARHESYYKDYIDLLIAEKQPERAFETLERSRARTLLETLTTAHVDIRKGADPALIEQERSLQQKLTAKSNYRVQLLEEKHTDEQVHAVDKEIADLLSQYQDVESQIRSSSPAYAALTQPHLLTGKEVQQQLLDDETVLIEYSLGEQHSHVFALTPTTLNSYELPKRAAIEQQARLVYSLLASRNRNVESETAAKKQIRLRREQAQYKRAAAELSRMLLAPVAEQIKGKRLLIVTDGALGYIPFAMLPAPESASVNAEPLVVGHEIVNLPSASVLAVLRRQQATRAPAPKAVAVLADPVFAKDDFRVSSSHETSQRPVPNSETESRGLEDPHESSSFAAGLLLRSAGDIGLNRRGSLHFQRLPFSRLEAEAIAAVSPKEKTLQALDFRASRSTAMSADLTQYRIVHFATHGLLDSRHPELSGLVLSLVNERGKPENGFLGLQDIYNMNLAADLVVLSACETGLGKQVDGEGLVGLTRGFMYAGASRVVASLWSVSDEATAKLMGDFYKAMEEEGMRPAAALRAAQIAMWKQRRWHDPYFWAAFQIQGEWK